MGVENRDPTEPSVLRSHAPTVLYPFPMPPERPEKKGAQRACLDDFWGDDISFPVMTLYGDYFISRDIRIPSLANQDSMESHKGFLTVAHLLFRSC